MPKLIESNKERNERLRLFIKQQHQSHFTVKKIIDVVKCSSERAKNWISGNKRYSLFYQSELDILEKYINTINFELDKSNNLTEKQSEKNVDDWLSNKDMNIVNKYLKIEQYDEQNDHELSSDNEETDIDECNIKKTNPNEVETRKRNNYIRNIVIKNRIYYTDEILKTIIGCKSINRIKGWFEKNKRDKFKYDLYNWELDDIEADLNKNGCICNADDDTCFTIESYESNTNDNLVQKHQPSFMDIIQPCKLPEKYIPSFVKRHNEKYGNSSVKNKSIQQDKPLSQSLIMIDSSEQESIQSSTKDETIQQPTPQQSFINILNKTEQMPDNNLVNEWWNSDEQRKIEEKKKFINSLNLILYPAYCNSYSKGHLIEAGEKLSIRKDLEVYRKRLSQAYDMKDDKMSYNEFFKYASLAFIDNE